NRLHRLTYFFTHLFIIPPPHHLEMLTILAANDFFKRDRNDINDSHIFMFLSRETAGQVMWADLPDYKNVQERLLTFTTMSCSFIGFWYGLLKHADFKSSQWYHRYIRKDLDIDDSMGMLEKYMEDFFLPWLLGLHVECGERDKMSYKDWIHKSPAYNGICLFSHEMIKGFFKDGNGKAPNMKGDALNKLKWRSDLDTRSYYEPKEPYPYDFLWKEACDAKLQEKITSYDSLSRVFHILCETSKKFIKTNYSS
ncbi:MAG: hypothetical protein HQK98_08655, partial [Nitrospirae bacterium]|nr:hypothetical protein [Nitrospirota bacterium]